MEMHREVKNYYEVLEIPTASSQEEIHTGYVRAKNAYSGDSLALYSLMTEQECNEILNLIEEAYSVLSVPHKRREYDKVRGFNADRKEVASTQSLLQKVTPINNQNIQVQQDHSFTEVKAGDEEAKFQILRKEAEVSRIAAKNRFALSYDKDEQFEQEIESASEFDGPFLQKIREYKDVTVERMANMTKISKTYIRNIESGDYEKLPAPVYVRGFIYQYAKCLKLSPDLVASSYIRIMKSQGND